MSNWPYPRIVAHRGGGKLAPENTLAAIDVGARYGHTMIEFDAKLSKDGQIFLLHDDNLERTSNGWGVAGELAWDDLLKVDAGSWFSREFKGEPLPLLSQVAERCRCHGMMANIEIKPTTGLGPQTGNVVALVICQEDADLLKSMNLCHHAIVGSATNPTEVLGDERGWVTGIRCVEMELGEPDESGRRSPVVKEGSEFEIECDVVIMALGTSPNPLLAATTAGLETTRRGCITADERGATTRPGVFAGGDAVTGAATVILAMGAGRTAAKAIDEYVKSRANGTH